MTMTTAPPVAGPQSPHPVGLPPAHLDRRVTACAVDRALAWGLAAGVGYAGWRFTVAPDRPWLVLAWFGGAVVVIGLVMAVVLGTTGTSPGKALTGLRVVRQSDGRPIGVLAAVERTVVLGLAGLPTLGLGLATLGWTAAMDPDRRRRGIHDRIGDAVVVDLAPQEEVAPVEEQRPQQVVNLTAMRLLPSPAAPDPIQQVPDPSPAPYVDPSEQTQRSLARRAAAPSPQPGSAMPAVAPVAPQPATMPVAPPAPAPQAAPVPPLPPPARPPQPAPAVQPAPVAQPAPVVQPAPAPRPAVAAPAPVTNPATNNQAATNLAAGGPAHAALAPRWRVTFDTGETFVVEGLALVGRRPEPRPGEQVRHVVPLRSSDMSVSKTHAQFQVAPDGALVVMDRGSTNGTHVVRRGHSRTLSPGRPTTLVEGDAVRFGDRTMQVVKEA